MITTRIARQTCLLGASRQTLAIMLAISAGALAAQVPAGSQNDATSTASPPGAELPPAGNQELGLDESEEIVVTGSFIRGTPEDAALPVDVINSEELARRGSPSQVDFIKSLTFVGPVLGDSNQYSPLASQQVGVGTINLRGLGSQRTLVLLNGRRTVVSPGPGSAGVDTKLMPAAAIGRVEILKDGAAAVYGSDAIAGVVNFITRRDLTGFEVSADYRYIDGSDGDYGGAIAYGDKFEGGNLLFSFGYQRRSELPLNERPELITPYLVNPAGYTLLGQPPTFTPRAGTMAVAGAQRDANCAAVGSYPGFTGTTPACFLQIPAFSSLIDKEERFQAYGEFNYDLTSNHRFHAEILYAKTDVPAYRVSPSFPPIQGPNGPGSVGVFTVPVSNPGAATALQQSGLTPAQIAATDNLSLTFFRPFGAGGNPAFGNAGLQFARKYDVFRLSGGLSGDLPIGGLGYDLGLTYARSTFKRGDRDILITRLQRALNGFGGVGCTGTTPGANGCQYLNPFSNGYAENTALGLRNPGFVPANANSPELAASLFEELNFKDVQDLFVVDAVVNGEIPGFELPGGPIGFAVGGQLRYGEAEGTVESDLANSLITPCPTVGVTNCAVRTGPFIFRGQGLPTKVSENIRAVFAELNIPVLDTVNVQAAVRYEDYGGLTGSTTNPKFAAKWQVFDSLALRGSVSSTFRGPTPANRAPVGVSNNVGIIAAGNNFKSVDFLGNPAVGPETADTFNVGVIFESGGFRAIVDYYGFKLKDQIVNLPAQIVATSVAGVGNGSQLVNCAAALRDLITFSNNNTCTQGLTIGNDIQRVRADTVNGPAVETSGIDASVDFDFPQPLLGGDLTVGGSISYVLKYKQEAFAAGGLTVSPAYDAVGFANYDRLPGTLPEYRANAYFNYARGIHNLRAMLNHIDGVTDNRAPIFVQNGPSTTPCTAASPSPPCVPITFGREVGSFTTVDLTYRVELPFDAALTASVFNLLDQEAPDARLEQSFDSLIANPFGRSFKIAVTKQF